MQQNSAVLSLDDLPDELVLEMIGFLWSIPTVGSLAATSWRYNRLAMDDSVWRDFYLDRFGIPSKQLCLLRGDRSWRWLYRACLPVAASIGPTTGTISLNEALLGQTAQRHAARLGHGNLIKATRPRLVLAPEERTQEGGTQGMHEEIRSDTS
jgi:hypothetical protein